MRKWSRNNIFNISERKSFLSIKELLFCARKTKNFISFLLWNSLSFSSRKANERSALTHLPPIKHLVYAYIPLFAEHYPPSALWGSLGFISTLHLSDCRGDSVILSESCCFYTSNHPPRQFCAQHGMKTAACPPYVCFGNQIVHSFSYHSNDYCCQ